MPKICYVPKQFRGSSFELIQHANTIIATYAAQGFTLTLRQLYYQFIARALMPNTMKSYSRLGNVVNDARLAGLIDWDAIEDRTRNVRSLAHWDNPNAIVEACAEQFHLDLWQGQEARIEVWIEKDALIGVIEDICNEWDVQYFSCRGYVSQSEMWAAAMRAVQRAKNYKPSMKGMTGQRTVVLHLGDHDPSGLDMTRDITDRINLFCAKHGYPNTFEMRRLALNMDQVEQYTPPPNPAKVTDSRFAQYQQEHGDESWELDALEPTVLAALIGDEIESIIDIEKFEQLREAQGEDREELKKVAARWDDVVHAIDTGSINN
jgi:hypothetical protein